MKLWLFFLLWFTIPGLKDVRALYPAAIESEAASESFYNLLKDIPENADPRLVAYKGAALTLVARFKKSAKEKSKTFRAGAKLIEHAVERAPNDIEVRFVRLSVQQHAPRFLKYNEAVLSDKHYVVSQVKLMQPGALKNYISDYILKSDKFTDEEKAQIAG